MRQELRAPSVPMQTGTALLLGKVARFALHGLEMCAAMCIGLAALDPLYGWLAAQAGVPNPYLRLPELSVAVVEDIDAAIAHIRHYGSDHTEVIATRDEAIANRFVHALRSAVVMVNTSSRFSDGGELGLGAEIGISTTRLHAYGPMGAESLTIERFVLRGNGQVRHGRGSAAAGSEA